MTVQQMIEATPLGPILDRPVAEVLAGFGLPPLPVLPPLPPLPGLPPIQIPPLDQLIKPMTDLLGGFGTGDLGAGGFDPSAVFDALSTVLDTALATGKAALDLGDKLWSGQAAAGATQKTVQAGANGAALSVQGSGMNIDINAAAAIVGQGLAAVQAIIAKTVAAILGAAVPLICSPAVGAGLAMASGFAATGLTEATAAVAATRAALLGPTARMTTNGAPVPVTKMPGAPSPAPGQSPFALAGAVLDAVSPALSTATELPATLMTPVTKMLELGGPRPAATAPHNGGAHADSVGPDGDRDGRTRAAMATGGTGGVGAFGMTGGGAPATLGAAKPNVVTTVASVESTGISVPPGARGALTTPTAMPVGGAPIAGAAVRGTGGSGEHHTIPDYLISELNGQHLVGTTPESVPAVIGDDDHDAPPAPDIELRLGPPIPVVVAPDREPI